MGWSMGWDNGHMSVHDDGRSFHPVRKNEYRVVGGFGAMPVIAPPWLPQGVSASRRAVASQTVDIHSTDHFDVTEWESMYSSALTQGDQRAVRLETCIAEGARLAEIGL
jgi:hypothetical protein